MARPPRTSSLDAVLRETAAQIVTRISGAIARQVADLVQDGLKRELASRPASRRGAPRRARRGEITRWVADARARRVPTFVIEATGLDTKKKIVAKFGPGAAFEKGKPPPKAKG
jgi:hypothetical protein